MASTIRINKICRHCGNEFVAKTTVTKYCGEVCAKRAYKARKKAEKVNAAIKETQEIINTPIVDIQAKDFLSVQDVCRLFKVSRTTVWRLTKEGKVHSAKIGRKKFITRSSIDALFNPVITPPPKPEPPKLKITECWHIGEIERLYDLHSKTLYDIIRRFEIPTMQDGKFVYAPKERIISIFGNPQQS